LLALVNFFETMANNSVLLILLLPVVGSVLVRALSKAGREAAYFTAIMNAWLTMSLAAVMVTHFETQPEDESQYQMTSSLGWTVQREKVPASNVTDKNGETRQLMKTQFSGPDARIAVGVDSLSLWFVFLVVAGNLAAIYAIPFDDPDLVSRLSWTLIAEAAMAGTFAATDAVLLCFCLALSVWCLYLLIGMSGESNRREVARRFFRMHAFSTAVIMLGVIGLCVSYWWMRMTPSGPRPDLTFALDRILWGIPNVILLSTSAADFWPSVAPWLFILMMIAAASRAALPPFHHWWYRVARETDKAVMVSLLTGFLPFGFYIANRVIAPVFPTMAERAAPHLATWGIVAVAFIALGSLSLRTIAERLSACVLVVLTAAFSFSFVGSSVISNGSSLQLLTCVGSASAFLLLIPGGLSHRYFDDAHNGNPAVAWPTWHKWLVFIPLAGLMHLPFTGVFWGDLVLIQAVFPSSNAQSYVLIGAFAITSVSLLEPMQRLRAWTCDASIRFKETRIGLVPILVFLLIIGLLPNIVSSRLPIPPVQGTAEKAHPQS
jgi:NADH-quinone oxidoreductase subunit M